MNSQWPPELLAWMHEALQPGFRPQTDQNPDQNPDKSPDDGPDFDAIRREANASWALASARNLRDF